MTDPNPDPQPVTDTWTVRLVVIALAAVAAATVVGGVVLAAMTKPVPSEIVALGSAAVGALSALLASTRSLFTKNQPTP